MRYRARAGAIINLADGTVMDSPLAVTHDRYRQRDDVGYVYALVHPTERTTYRYIGQTVRPVIRLQEHARGRGAVVTETLVQNHWAGETIDMVVLREGVYWLHLEIAEMACIVDAIRAGHPVLNVLHERFRWPDQPLQGLVSCTPFQLPPAPGFVTPKAEPDAP